MHAESYLSFLNPFSSFSHVALFLPLLQKDFVIYNDPNQDPTIPIVLDPSCTRPDGFCLGTIAPFKNKVFKTLDFTDTPLGTNIGQCLVVAEGDAGPEFYCSWTVSIDGIGDIAVQGPGTLTSQDFPIVGGTGKYAGAEGTLTSTPNDDFSAYKYEFEFL